MSSAVFVLWFENVNPDILSAVSSLERMAANGIDIHLTPSPLAEKRACYYQALTGVGAGKIGYFDAVKPVSYQVYPEEEAPDGVVGRLLTDILHTRGLSAAVVEAKNRDELEAVVQQPRDCTIVRVLVESDPDIIEEFITCCTERLTADTHLLVLAGVWHEPAARFVNPNNFLADIGLLEVGTPRSRESIVWSETLAYYLGSGQIWINLRGRELQGSVAAGREYQQVCEAIQQELMAWQDPDTHEAIVKRVLKKEDAYDGDYLFKAPDLIVEYYPGYAASSQAMLLDFDTFAVYTATSKASMARGPYARLIAMGTNLVRGCSENAQLVDVMPNVMYLLGQPVPGHIDGKIIPSLFTSSHRQHHPQKQSEDDEFRLTGEEEGLVEDRLRALGYLG